MGLWTRNFSNCLTNAYGCYRSTAIGYANNTVDAPTDYTKDLTVQLPNDTYKQLEATINDDTQTNIQFYEGNYSQSPCENKSNTFLLMALGLTQFKKTCNYCDNEGKFSICVGSGYKALDYDDHKLESIITTNLSIGSTLIRSSDYDADNHLYKRSLKVLFTYSGTDAITIKEYGLSICAHNVGGILIYRDLLDTPKTLNTNDSIEITVQLGFPIYNYHDYPSES